jgi:type II secretory pathway pseudopilin PulG
MNVRQNKTGRILREAGAYQAAFTLIEVLAGSVVLLIMGVSLYGGLTYGVNEVRLARQNTRATEILTEKMEVARLINWTQLTTTPGFVPASFNEPFYSSNPTNAPAGSLIYTGHVAVATAPITESYSNDLRIVTVTLTWTLGGTTHSRQMSTFISQWGEQNYVY